MGNNRNTIIAVVLSLLVVVGWQYFVGYPQMERQRQQAELKQQEQSQAQPGATNRAGADQPQATPGGAPGAAAPEAPGVPNTASPQAQVATREAVIKSTRRHRHGAARRLGRSQRRPHRRPAAPAIPRDHRSEFTADRDVRAVRRAR